MALKNFIKINNVSSLSDARYCAGMGVDILGFSLLEDTPSFVNPEQFKEITQWVSGPKFAGEFDTAGLETIQLASVDYKLDYIETSVAAHLEDLVTLGIPIIYKSTINTEEDINKLKNEISYSSDLISYLHLELMGNALAKHFTQLESAFKNLILHVSSPLQKLESLSGHGISLTASIEEHTGLQDYGEIMDVLEALEIDD